MAHVGRREELSFLDVHDAAGARGRDEQIRLPREERRDLQDVRDLGGARRLRRLVDVGQDRYAGGFAHARERGIPYFGICYGFQWAAVEYARHVCGLADADSTECAPDTKSNVIYKLRDLLGVDDLGGTMRLGSYACQLKPSSKAHALYGADVIHERHRHRYEFNCLFERSLTERGLEIVGRSLDGKFVEIIELPTHPWYIAVQFHPEFKSKPLEPHPLFAGFVDAPTTAQTRSLTHSAISAR